MLVGLVLRHGHEPRPPPGPEVVSRRRPVRRRRRVRQGRTDRQRCSGTTSTSARPARESTRTPTLVTELAAAFRVQCRARSTSTRDVEFLVELRGHLYRLQATSPWCLRPGGLRRDPAPGGPRPRRPAALTPRGQPRTYTRRVLAAAAHVCPKVSAPSTSRRSGPAQCDPGPVAPAAWHPPARTPFRLASAGASPRSRPRSSRRRRGTVGARGGQRRPHASLPPHAESAVAWRLHRLRPRRACRLRRGPRDPGRRWPDAPFTASPRGSLSGREQMGLADTDSGASVIDGGGAPRGLFGDGCLYVPERLRDRPSPAAALALELRRAVNADVLARDEGTIVTPSPAATRGPSALRFRESASRAGRSAGRRIPRPAGHSRGVVGGLPSVACGVCGPPATAACRRAELGAGGAPEICRPPDGVPPQPPA